jgi:hypothetical protein
MKKLKLAIALMTLLLAFLSSSLLATRVNSQTALTCQTLSGCCGAAGCQGPGTPNGCAATCAGGGSITCEVVKNGKCGGELND